MGGTSDALVQGDGSAGGDLSSPDWIALPMKISSARATPRALQTTRVVQLVQRTISGSSAD